MAVRVSWRKRCALRLSKRWAVAAMPRLALQKNVQGDIVRVSAISAPSMFLFLQISLIPALTLVTASCAWAAPIGATIAGRAEGTMHIVRRGGVISRIYGTHSGQAIAHEAAGSNRGHGASFLSDYDFEIPEPPNMRQPRRKAASHGGQGNKSNLEGFFRPIGHSTEPSDKFTVYRAGSQSAPEVHDFANLPPLLRKSTPETAGATDKHKRLSSIRSGLASIEPMLPTPRIV